MTILRILMQAGGDPMWKSNASLLLLLAASLINVVQAQERLDFDAACSYYGEPSDDQVWGFSSDSDAESAVERIMNYTGLPQNFEVMRGNVDNAMATLRGEARLIVYNQSFMERVKESTSTDWSAISILAHEIGHHLAGHTLQKNGSRPKTELEADRFSGHVLFKMGSQLEEAKAAMNAVAGDAGSSTHPPKSARLVAIETGWFDARDQAPAQPQSTAAQSSPQTPNTTAQNNPLTQAGTQPNLQQQYPAPATMQPGSANTLPALANIQPMQAYGPQVLAEARFVDGGIAFILSDNSIVMNYLGMTIPVAYREASSDAQFAWLYVVSSGDEDMQDMLEMFGMSSTTIYGVDHNGVIWGSNMFGQATQVGQVYYH